MLVAVSFQFFIITNLSQEVFRNKVEYEQLFRCKTKKLKYYYPLKKHQLKNDQTYIFIQVKKHIASNILFFVVFEKFLEKGNQRIMFLN